MRTDHEISVTIDDDEVSSILQVLHAINVSLVPLTHSLSPTQRNTLQEIDTRTIAFLNERISFFNQNTNLPTADLKDLRNNLKIVNKLAPITHVVGQLYQDLNDTIQLAGTKALRQVIKMQDSSDQLTKKTLKYEEKQLR